MPRSNRATSKGAKNNSDRESVVAAANKYGNPLKSTDFNDCNVTPPYVRSKTRLQSWCMRELLSGKALVESNDISLLECIGEGEFGIVYKASIRSSRGPVAVKTLKGEFNQVHVDRFVEESLKMRRFKHVHVMGLIGVCVDSGSAPYIIMPYMANGSLLKYLRRERKNIVILNDTDDDELKEVCKRLMVICSQIASGMEYLAAEKYVHRDLAARNCMIDAHFVIKITDFGLSEDVFERNYFRQESTSGEVVKLPIKWMAPESLSDGHFSEKSDVWSYGVTMWEIFSGGKAPYPGTDPLTLMRSLEKGHRMPQPYNSACNEEIYGVMFQCWEMSPENRPSFKEICSTVSKYIERIAGYLDIGYNPLTVGGMKEEGVCDTENEEENEDAI